MQPYLHIFSHFAFPTPPPPAKPLLTGGFSAATRGARRVSELQRGVQPLAMNARLQITRPRRPVAPRAYDRVPAARPATKGTTPCPQPAPTTAAPALAASLRARASRGAALLAAGQRCCGLRLEQPRAAPSADPAGVVPASARAVRGRDRPPGGRAEDSRARRRRRPSPTRRDPYLRLLGSAADARLAAAELRARRRAVARPPRRDLPRPRWARSSALRVAAGAGPARQLAARRVPVRRRRRPGRDRARHERRAPRRARSWTPRPRTPARTRPATAGVSYEASAGGVAFGLVDRFAVIGSESGLHGVIDTTLGGGVAGARRRLLEAARRGAAGRPRARLLEPGRRSHGGRHGAGRASGLLALLAGTREANVSLVPSSSSLALDVDTLAPRRAPAKPAGCSPPIREGAQALDELPGESWLAIGLGHLGTTLAADVQGLQRPRLARRRARRLGRRARSTGTLSLKLAA